MHGPVSIVENGYPILALGVRDAAEEGLAQAADRMVDQGGSVFATTEKVERAEKLAFQATGHPLTDAWCRLFLSTPSSNGLHGSAGSIRTFPST